MEELKNENVVEQRPSTKYGRTAYQQQLQEEQAAQAESQQNNAQSWEGLQNPYQKSENMQSVERPYQQYTAYQEVKPAVKKWPAHVLMVLVVLATMLSFAVNVFLSQAYSMGNTLEEVVDATIALSEEPTIMVLASISDLIFIVTVALLAIDIIQLRKAGKKTGGAIAFAILLRPAYFIWRAHLLGEKKVFPILYAVIVYMISIAQYYVLLSASMDMVMRTMY